MCTAWDDAHEPLWKVHGQSIDMPRCARHPGPLLQGIVDGSCCSTQPSRQKHAILWRFGTILWPFGPFLHGFAFGLPGAVRCCPVMSGALSPAFKILKSSLGQACSDRSGKTMKPGVVRLKRKRCWFNGDFLKCLSTCLMSKSRKTMSVWICIENHRNIHIVPS